MALAALIKAYREQRLSARVLSATIGGAFLLFSICFLFSGINLSNSVQIDPDAVFYNERVKLDPSDALAYDNWGRALAAKKDYDGAIAQLRQAIKFDPKNPTYYDNWGEALATKKDYDGAIAKYQQVIKLDHTNELFRADLEAARRTGGTVKPQG